MGITKPRRTIAPPPQNQVCWRLAFAVAAFLSLTVAFPAGAVDAILLPGSTTTSPSMYVPRVNSPLNTSAKPFLIVCKFYDEDAPAVGVPRVSISIQSPAPLVTDLAVSIGDGGAGVNGAGTLTITADGGGFYTVTLPWNPADTLAVGLYDLQFAVDGDGVGGVDPGATDTYANNTDEMRVGARGFYVNDGFTAGDVYCTNIGADNNNANTQAIPTDDLNDVPVDQVLTADDMVFVDTGTWTVGAAAPNAVVTATFGTADDGTGVSNNLFIIGSTHPNRTKFNMNNSTTIIAFYLNSGDYITITNFEIYNDGAGGSSLPVYATGSLNSEVRNCTFHDNAYSVYFTATSTNCTVRNCTFYANSAPSIFIVGSATATIDHNLIYGCGGDGVYLADGDNATITFNTIYNCGNFANVTIQDSGGGSTGTVLKNNNLWSASPGHSCVYMTALSETGLPANNFNYNNLYATNGANIGFRVAAYHATLAAWQTAGATDEDMNSISADPRFVSVAPGSEDFHEESRYGSYSGGLWTPNAANSPCIDAADPAQGFALEPANNGGRANQGVYGNTAQASKRDDGTNTTVWTGANGTTRAWNNHGNWSGGEPTSARHATIASATFNPLLTVAGTTSNLSITTGILPVNAGGSLNVYGSLSKTGGTWTNLAGTTVLLLGSGNQSINPGGTAFQNLTVNSTGGTVTATGAWTVNGTYTQTAGTADLGAVSTTFGGATNINGGTLQTGSGAATFNGAVTVNSGGTWKVAAGTATAAVGPTVALGGTLYMTGNGILRIGNALTLTVNGTLSTLASGGIPKITTSGTEGINFYGISVGATGRLYLVGLDVVSVNSSGLNVAAGAAYDYLDKVNFSLGQAGVRYLNLHPAFGTFKFRLNTFDLSAGTSVALNDGLTGSTAAITMENSGGAKGDNDFADGFTGESTDLDPDGDSHITWTYFKTWTGAINQWWGVAGNWEGGVVPVAGEDVLIRAGGNPAVLNQNVSIRNITIDSGGELRLGSYTLTITGDTFRSDGGTFTPNTGTVSLQGAADQVISSGLNPFYNLEIASGGTVNLVANLTVQNNLTVTTGTLNLNGFAVDLTAGGAAAFTVATSKTVLMGGNSTLTTSATTTSTINGTVSMSGSASWVSNGSLIVSGTGTLSMTGSTILRIADAATATINGTFSSSASGGSTPTVTKTSAGAGGFGFSMAGSGTINVTALSFSYAGLNGLNISAGTVNLTAINNIAFTNAASGGRHLRVVRTAAGGPFSSANCSFDSVAGGGKNVTLSGGGAFTLTMVNSSGVFGGSVNGPANEDQLTGTINWNKSLVWAGKWRFRQTITITPQGGINVPAGFPVLVGWTAGHAATEDAGINASGADFVDAEGDDIRIVYYNSGTGECVELARNILDARTANTQIWFKTRYQVVAGTPDSNYFLYYGASAADAANPPTINPQAAGSGFLSDDFERGSPGWTHFGPDDTWELGTPSNGGAGGPASAYRGTKAWSTDLNGNYLDAAANFECNLQLPRINTSGWNAVAPQTGMRVQYRRWHQQATNDTEDMWVDNNNDQSFSGVAVGRWTDAAWTAVSFDPTAGYEIDNTATADIAFAQFSGASTNDDGMNLENVIVRPTLSSEPSVIPAGFTTITSFWSDPFNWSPPGVPDANTDVTINGGYTYAPTLDVSSTIYSLDVTNGTLIVAAGSPDLTVAGDIAIGASGAFNASAGADSDITLGGNWTLTTGGTFTAGASTQTVTCNGGDTQRIQGTASTTFREFATSTASTLVLIDTAATVNSTTTVGASGTLRVSSGVTLTCSGGTTTVNGTLDVEPGATFRLAGTSTLTVATTGTLEAVGTSDSARAIFTSTDTLVDGTGYGCLINGTLNASWAKFEYMGPNGIIVRDSDGANNNNGATITALNDTKFDNPSTPSGVMLNFNDGANDWDKTANATYASNDFRNAGGAATPINVRGGSSGAPLHGVLSFIPAAGTVVGEAFDDDTASRIEWPSVVVPDMTGAIADDNSGGGSGIQFGDRVTLTLDSPTNGFPINDGNINTTLILSGGHVWGSGLTISWNSPTNTILTIQFGLGATVAPGDSITIAGATIRDVTNTNNATGSNPPITGSFGADTPTLSSAVANDPPAESSGIGAGDTVILRFDKATNGYGITNFNIDSVLVLPLGHSWTNGTLNGVTSAIWSTNTFSNDTLTITFSGSGTAPTVTVGDTISVAAATIRDITETNNAVGSPPLISGAFGSDTPAVLSAVADNNSGSGAAGIQAGDRVKLTFDAQTNAYDVLQGGGLNASLPVATKTWGNGTFTAVWTLSNTVLTITFVTIGGTVPTVLSGDSLSITGGTIRDLTGTINATGSPLAIGGSFNPAGPKIVSVVAEDPAPNDGPGIQNTDRVILTFNIPTDSYTAGLTTASILSHITISGGGTWGGIASASWLDNKTLIVTFDGTGAPTIAVGALLSFPAATEVDDLGGTLNATNVDNVPITGSFGGPFTPDLTGATAADNTAGAGIDSDDTVTLTFDRATNAYAITQANIDSVLVLSGGHSWGGITSAVWSGGDTVLTITFSGSGGPTIVAGGSGDSITIAASTIRDSTNTNNVTGSPPVVGGTFGPATTPELTLAQATGAGTAAIQAGDQLTLTFDDSTNGFNVLSGSGLNTNLPVAAKTWGNGTFTAVWSASNTILTITFSTIGGTPPTIAVGDAFTIVASTIRDGTNTNLWTDTPATPISGSFGGLPPALSSATASDPGDLAGFQSGQDRVTLLWNAATNSYVVTPANIDTVLPIEGGTRTWGSIVSAVWGPNTTLTVILGTGMTLAIGDDIGVAPGTIRDLATGSVNATGSPPAITGNFGRGPIMQSATAADDSLEGSGADVGDTVSVTFNAPTNGFAITTANVLATLPLSAGHIWGGISSAIWSNSYKTVKVTFDGTGSPTAIEGDTLGPPGGPGNIKDAGNNTNAVGTAVIGGTVGHSITGNLWQSDRTTAIPGSVTMRSFRGSTQIRVKSMSGGTFDIKSSDTAGDVVALYLEDGTYKGSVVTVVNGLNISSVNLYQNHFVIRNDNAGTTTTANLNAVDNDVLNPTYVLYNVDASSNLTSSLTSGVEIAGNFTASGSLGTGGSPLAGLRVTSGTLNLVGANGLSHNTNAFTLTGGELTFAGANYGTLTVSGATTLSGGTLTMDTSGANPDVLDINGNLTITAATMVWPATSTGGQIRLAGNWSDTNAASNIDPAGGAVIFDGGAGTSTLDTLGTERFFDVTANGASRVVEAQDPLLIDGSLTLTNGTFRGEEAANGSNRTHVIGGDLVLNGGTIETNAAAATTVILDVGGNFTASSGAVSTSACLSTDEIQVAGNVSVTSATFQCRPILRMDGASNNTVSMDTGALFRVLRVNKGAAATEVRVTGANLRASQLILQTGTLNVSGAAASVQIGGVPAGNWPGGDPTLNTRFDGTTAAGRVLTISNGAFTTPALLDPMGTNDADNMGTLNLSGGTLTVSGDVNFGDARVFAINLTGGTLACGGNWTVQDSGDADAPTWSAVSPSMVVFDGTGAQSIAHGGGNLVTPAFYNFQVGQGANGPNALSLSTNMTCNDFDVVEGIFAPGDGRTVTRTGVTATDIQAGGTLRLGAGTLLQLGGGAGSALNVAGTLSTTSGTGPGNRATIQGTGFYAFSVAGTMNTNYLWIDDLDATGVAVGANATLTGWAGLRFSGGENPGGPNNSRYINLSAATGTTTLPQYIDDCWFEAGPDNNVLGTGTGQTHTKVTFRRAAGTLGTSADAEPNEYDDANDLIDWSSGAEVVLMNGTTFLEQGKFPTLQDAIAALSAANNLIEVRDNVIRDETLVLADLGFAYTIDGAVLRPPTNAIAIVGTGLTNREILQNLVVIKPTASGAANEVIRNVGRVYHCTIVGAGTLVRKSSGAAAMQIQNTIVGNPSAWAGAPIVDEGGGGSASVTYSDVAGGYAGAGNIASDPLLVNYDTAGEMYDVHLRETSPCIDAATPIGSVTTDMDRGSDFENPAANPRRPVEAPNSTAGYPTWDNNPAAGDTADIGADEFGPLIVGAGAQARPQGVPLWIGKAGDGAVGKPDSFSNATLSFNFSPTAMYIAENLNVAFGAQNVRIAAYAMNDVDSNGKLDVLNAGADVRDVNYGAPAVQVQKIHSILAYRNQGDTVDTIFCVCDTTSDTDAVDPNRTPDAILALEYNPSGGSPRFSRKAGWATNPRPAGPGGAGGAIGGLAVGQQTISGVYCFYFVANDGYLYRLQVGNGAPLPAGGKWDANGKLVLTAPDNVFNGQFDAQGALFAGKFNDSVYVPARLMPEEVVRVAPLNTGGLPASRNCDGSAGTNNNRLGFNAIASSVFVTAAGQFVWRLHEDGLTWDADAYTWTWQADLGSGVKTTTRAQLFRTLEAHVRVGAGNRLYKLQRETGFVSDDSNDSTDDWGPGRSFRGNILTAPTYVGGTSKGTIGDGPPPTTTYRGGKLFFGTDQGYCYALSYIRDTNTFAPSTEVNGDSNPNKQSAWSTDTTSYQVIDGRPYPGFPYRIPGVKIVNLSLLTSSTVGRQVMVFITDNGWMYGFIEPY